MTALSDLIARLEAAKEGSRELDSQIAVAVFETQKTDDDLIYAKPCARSDNRAAGTYWHVQRSGMSLRTAPPYTTSFDVALTLIPDGYHLQLSQASAPGRSDWSVTVSKQSPGFMRGYSGKLALALCIAALKARDAAR